jgi:hypothetical protein
MLKVYVVFILKELYRPYEDSLRRPDVQTGKAIRPEVSRISGTYICIDF